jgi:hypothetical protein
MSPFSVKTVQELKRTTNKAFPKLRKHRCENKKKKFFLNWKGKKLQPIEQKKKNKRNL